MWPVCPRQSEEEKEVCMAGNAAVMGGLNVLRLYDQRRSKRARIAAS